MTYHLQIATPDGKRYDGQAVRLIVPTIDGQVGILARHINYVTALGMGPAKLVTEDGERHAACIGGMLAVTNGEVKVLATTFEWAEDIDVDRAKASIARAEKMLEGSPDEHTVQYANARIKRANVRLGVAEKK